MEQLTLIVHLLLAIAIIGFVLIQQGKGADAGASFGGGSSQTVFGGQGAGNFLSRATAILATVFFITSLTLAMYAKQKVTGASDLGIPSAEVIERLERDTPFVEQYSPLNDMPELDASVGNEPVVQ